jgi:hypothetical protein
MKIALVDNGSVEPAAHLALRRAADSIAALAGMEVEAVSWRHSSRIPPVALGGRPAHTLARWVHGHHSAGETEFVLVPFFISPQGAVGSSLRAELDSLRARAGGFDYVVTGGLGDSPVLPQILAERVRETAAGLGRTPVVVVDHGGPSRESAAVRDRAALGAREILGAGAPGARVRPG